MDDWKQETQARLETSLIYQTLKSKCADKDAEVMSLVDGAVSYAYQRTKTIIRHMGEFTLHDGEHLFRVLKLMELLLTESNIKKLSVPELMLLVLSAFFHDIGMAPDEKEVMNWKKVWDAVQSFDSEEELQSFNKFKRFYQARPDQHIIINQLIHQGKNSEADTIKAYLITEYIRQTHAERAREIISQNWNNKIVYRDNDLTVEFAQICYSHNEDASKLLEIDNNYLCGNGIVASLQLVGVILRLADILDFDAKRTPSILYSHLYVRNPVSIKEWSKHRAVEAWHISPDIIQFSAKCAHPAIESSIHSFCDLIDHELNVCNNIVLAPINTIVTKSRDIHIIFPFKVNRDRIETKKDIYNKPIYTYRETHFNLSKKQVTDLLMGTKLYGNPEVALRELLQNSIDACLLRKAQETKWGNTYTPEITVNYYFDGTNHILEMIDNGTGMDQYIIDHYYSKVGSSFYKSTDFYDLKSESNADFTPTSRFGIGILSSFMVADTLIVDTRRLYAPHKSSEALNVTVEGQDSIFWIKPGERQTPGTSTKLILRTSKNPWENMNDDAFIKSVENIIPNPPFKINIITQSLTKVIDENTFKNISASSLKDHSWVNNENVKLVEIKLDAIERGIIGSAIIAILESHNTPIGEINLNAKQVEIQGGVYTLDKKVTITENKIMSISKSISVSDDGGIHEYTYTNDLAKSKSKLSLHGIEVPTTLFPEAWATKNNQVKISWPFPLIIAIDISGTRDLDLNSSRTEIIMSEKWVDFEEELAFLVCSEMKNQLPASYWAQLVFLLKSRTNNEIFLRGLNKAIEMASSSISIL